MVQFAELKNKTLFFAKVFSLETKHYLKRGMATSMALFFIASASAQISADEYVNGLVNTLLDEGPATAEVYMQRHAESGLDLTPLKEAILSTNDGKNQRIEIPVHKNNLELVEYFDNRLREFGIDFVDLVAIVDNSLPDPGKPSLKESKVYATWQKYRIYFIATFSGLALLAASYVNNANHHISNDLKHLVNAIVSCVFVVTTEIMTAKFERQLNAALFSPARFQEPPLNTLSGKNIRQRLAYLWELLTKLKNSPEMKKIPELVSFAKMDLLDSIRGVSQVANTLLVDSLSKIKLPGSKEPFFTASFYYINLFNFVYHMAIYSVGAATSYLTGVQMDKTFLEMLWPTAKGTLKFYVALAFNQNLLGRLHRYGYITATSRMKAETTNIAAVKPGRMVMAYGYEVVGGWSMIIAGLINVFPAWRIWRELGQNAENTRAMYLANAERARLGTLEQKPVGEIKLASIAPSANIASKCFFLLKGKHLLMTNPLR